VGHNLLWAALRLSRQFGYQGRVGLHSLSDTEGLYRDRHMIDLGADPNKQNLHYFEWTPEAADAFERGRS